MSFTKSKEWHDIRRQGVGGSEVASILGISPYRTAYQVWEEKTGRKEPEDISSLPHIIRGHLGEETARMMIEKEMLKSFRPKMWKHPSIHYMRASDDGWCIDDNVILEIKTQGREKHAETAKGKIAEYYMCQVQYALYVSGATKCIFASFRPEDGTLYKVEVFPDAKIQDKIAAAVNNFWLNHVLTDKPPELSEGDYYALKDSNLEALVERYKTLYYESKKIEEELEELTEKIKPYTATKRAVVCGGVKLLRTERVGTIDYKSYLAQNKIAPQDLEKFRKAPTESFRIFVPQIDIKLG